MPSQRSLDKKNERIRVEAELRTSEERHRTILHTAMDGFWLVDMQGRLIEVNEAYCQMSGYSQKELLAMSISDFEANETAEETVAHIQNWAKFALNPVTGVKRALFLMSK